MNTVLENERDIFIIKYKRERDYTTLYNDCVNDEKLCAESLAFLVYVMSKPDDWRINLKNLSNRFNIGRDKTDRTIKELCALGYMKKNQPRSEDGSFSQILIYASDKPIFIVEADPLEVNESPDKQPYTEIQETVVINNTDKQPLTENPLTGFQETVPYIQIKDYYKENNNNKSISNPIASTTTTHSSEESNIYPDASVVVFFMNRIEGSGVPEATLVSWLRKYGTDYVAEKVRIYQSKGIMANPGGFLSSAIRYDWKEKKTTEPTKNASDHIKPSNKVCIDDAKNWFRYLTNDEKMIQYEKAIKGWYALEDALNLQKASVLDDSFVDSPWFKPMMETIGVKC